MEGAFGRYVSSPLFTFQIGPQKREITVHSYPFANLSPSLNTLMNGGMIEAKDRLVEWSDVDEDTFIRLCEYAYIHDYTPPSFHQIIIDHLPTPEDTENIPRKKKKKSKKNSGFYEAYSNEAEALPVSEPEPEAEWPEAEAKSEPRFEEARVDRDELPYKENSIWTGHLRDAFSNLALVSAPHVKSLNDPFVPKENTGPSQDFTPVFLGHAQLYIVADKYGIESLCQLVLSKLYQTLKKFKLYHEGVAAVIEFVRFVYSDTFRHAKGIDALRNLATRYIASVLGQLGEDKRFYELLEEGGDFVADFWRILWKTS